MVLTSVCILARIKKSGGCEGWVDDVRVRSYSEGKGGGRRQRQGYGIQTRIAKNEQWTSLIDRQTRLIRVLLHFVYCRRVWFLAVVLGSQRTPYNE